MSGMIYLVVLGVGFLLGFFTTSFAVTAANVEREEMIYQAGFKEGYKQGEKKHDIR